MHVYVIYLHITYFALLIDSEFPVLEIFLFKRKFLIFVGGEVGQTPRFFLLFWLLRFAWRSFMHLLLFFVFHFRTARTRSPVTFVVFVPRNE